MSSESAPTGVRQCGIADALALVGDRWALLALREIGLGITRFTDIQTNTGAPRASLTTRLRDLEGAGLVARHRYCQRPPRDEYLLTDASRALMPILGQLRVWGEQHAAPVVSGRLHAETTP